MRLMALAACALAAVAATLLWQAGAFQVLAWWLVEQQRAAQTLLGEQVAALRAGEPGALWPLLGICAGYGFLHAVGPGHGKVLIGGAAVGTGANARRMAAVAVAGSLGQALVAIALIYGGLFLFDATARVTVGAVETLAVPASHVALAAIGVWIVLRGMRSWPRAAGDAPDHEHDATCGCGHRHAPDPVAVAGARGAGTTLGIVAAMAARPCSGAMLLLAIAWSMGVVAAGALGVLAMGIGTASFTVLVAVLAVLGRDAALFSAGTGRLATVLLPLLQVVAGLALATVGGTLLVSALAA
jgi:nickel/cobalt transporter (NicO) family protein